MNSIMSYTTLQPSAAPPLQLSRWSAFTHHHPYLRDRTPESPSSPKASTSPEKSNADVVHRVLALFRERQAGLFKDHDPWTKFQLAPGDYDKIKRELEKDRELRGYVDDKIRYDYNAVKEQLAVRMPAVIHETLGAFISSAIAKRLRRIAKGSDNAAAFSKTIQDERSATIDLTSDINSTGASTSRQPDGSFRSQKTSWPGVVIEIMNSKKDKIPQLAYSYFKGSDQNIRAVICLDIAYGDESRWAKLSVWRVREMPGGRGEIASDVEDDLFRDELGNPTAHGGLRLRLSDFIKHTKGHFPEDQDQEIHVPAHEIVQFLSNSEVTLPHMLPKDEDPPGHVDLELSAPPSTPPEELLSEDEAQYANAENEEEIRTKGEDRSYRGGVLLRDIDSSKVHNTRSRSSPNF